MQFALGMGCTSSVARGGELVGGRRGWKEAAPKSKENHGIENPGEEPEGNPFRQLIVVHQTCPLIIG
jgi:hypothetical protein